MTHHASHLHRVSCGSSVAWAARYKVGRRALGPWGRGQYVPGQTGDASGSLLMYEAY